LQRYTKALSTLQRSSLVEKSRQKPQERMSILSNVGGLAFSLTHLMNIHDSTSLMSTIAGFENQQL
jgi:hypothetical protein